VASPSASTTRALVLAGDIGGTKANLGIFEVESGVPHAVRGAQFASPDYPGLAALVAEFLAGAGGIRAACFGVPGPVVENRTRTPNLAWEIDGAAVAGQTGVPAVVLINDLVATAEGIALLRPDELATLHPGLPGTAGAGNLALIAAGTGLGMALIPRLGGSWAPIPSEGGHMDFAPRDEEQAGLLAYLRERFGGHVSWERVVSGPGLFNVYSYLRESGHWPENPRVRQALAAGEDPSRVIGEAAVATDPERACGLCSRAVGLFVSVYGAVAANLALVGTATGGVYLGGGIAPKLLPRLQDGPFLDAFFDKGRFRSYLEAIPVRVILNDRAALLGAARHAATLLA
jgi:glucokinase